MSRLLPWVFKLSLLNLICLGVFFPGMLKAESVASDVSSCQMALETPRFEMRELLQGIKRNFVQFNWYYDQYLELVYRALWDAKQLKDDPFSPARQAKGEVLFARYQHQADSYLLEINEIEELVYAALDEFFGDIPGLTDFCSAWGYQDCALKWQDPFVEKVDTFRDLIQTHIDEQTELAEVVRNSLHDNPSEHHVFTARFHPRADRIQLEVIPQFLYLIRSLEEHLETNWVGGTCCNQCTAKSVEVAEDPFYTKMKADPEGYRGIQANVVGRQNLSDAFENFETGIEEGTVALPEEQDEEES